MNFTLPEVEIDIPYRPNGYKHPDVRRIVNYRTRRGLSIYSPLYQAGKAASVRFDEVGKFTIISKEEYDKFEQSRKEGLDNTSQECDPR